jgi:hypothetical protein
VRGEFRSRGLAAAAGGAMTHILSEL